MKLRNYQQNIINELRESLEKHRMVFVQSPTGSGKSFLIAYLSKLLEDNNNSNWILSHRHEIHNQLVKHCIKQKINPGQILSGQRMTNNITQVGMIQTVYNKLKHLDKIFPKLIQLDEAHRACNDTSCTILNYNQNTKVIGWSATPQRTDGQGMNNAGFTKLIQSLQTIDLINQGYLSPLVLLSSNTTELFRQHKFKIKNKDYDKNDVSKFASEKRILNDTIDMYNKYFNGNPAILFCCSVEDSKLVAEEMRNNGWNCEAVYDKLDYETRLKYINGLSNGSMNAICSYNLLTEGVDVPVLSGCIIRRKTKSIIMYLQMVGRTLRKAMNKKHAIVIDQAGNWMELSHPLLRKKWTLEGTVKNIEPENDIKIKTCPNCYAIILQKEKICPYCNEDLTNIKPVKKENIKIIHTPLEEIKPPEPILTGQAAVDISELMECEEQTLDTEIIERIQQIRNDKDHMRERLESISKYFNKSHKWCDYIWENFINK